MRLTGLLRFAGDVLATIDCGFDVPARGELEIVGSEGRMVLADPWHGRRPRIVLERGVEREVIKLKPVDSYRLELEDMPRAIRERARAVARARRRARPGARRSRRCTARPTRAAR